MYLTLSQQLSYECKPYEWQDKKYLTRGVLKKRGWNKDKITEILGEPDILIPKYKRLTGELDSYAPAYHLERVLEAEQSKSFQKWRDREVARRIQQSAQEMHIQEDQAKAGLELIKDVFKFELKENSWDEVFENCIQHWYEQKRFFLAEKGALHLLQDPPERWQDLSVKQLLKWCQNYFKHACSNYDELVRILHGRYGKKYALHWMRVEVMRQAAQKFNQTFEEASRKS